MSNAPEINPEIQKLLASKTVLIFDDQQSSRTLLRKFFLDHGVRPDKIMATKAFNEAVQFAEKEKPQVIVSEYEVGPNFGLELAALQMEYQPDKNERLFLIVSNLAEMSTVADSAEEEVDGFIVKPVSEGGLTKYILNSMEKKRNPSDYSKSIAQAKKWIDAGDFAAAEKELSYASLLTDNSAAVFYLRGFIAEKLNKTKDAIDHFDQALKLNKNYFKCLTAKFILTVKQKKYDVAYSLLKNIREKYPVTPEVLKNALITVVMSYRFTEVEEYFNVYLKQRRKSEELKYVVSLSFLTAGKMLLKEGKVEETLSYFKKGALISGRQKEYLEDVLTTLIDGNQLKACHEYFSMFGTDEISQSIIRCMRYRVFEKERRTEDQLLDEAKKLVFEGEADVYVCEAAIRLAKTKSNEMLLDSVLVKACTAFPDAATKFRELSKK